MKMLQEFKEFAVKGNMIDMAIGIIIGAASSKVVSSLVEDIIMPPLGYLIGKVNFKNLHLVILEAQTSAEGELIQPEIVLPYGNFLQVTLDFMIMALVLFMVVKVFNVLRRMGEDENEKSVPTPRDIELLASINETLVKMDSKLNQAQ
jgi:large conductance mechanosensitive channel